MLKTTKTDFRLYIIFLEHKFSCKGYRHKNLKKGKGKSGERKEGELVKGRKR